MTDQPLPPTEQPPASAVIIVSGPPGTGKTTLALRLAGDLRMPLLSKDAIKETLFDTLGWSDREWSRRLGGATMEVLYKLMEVELAAGRSFIVESNFRASLANQRFAALRAKFTFRPLQIQCRADGPVLLERFRQRALSGERHPGHVDLDTLAEATPELLAGFYEPLDLQGPLLDWDTTDLERCDYAAFLESVRRHLLAGE